MGSTAHSTDHRADWKPRYFVVWSKPNRAERRRKARILAKLQRKHVELAKRV
jgi:hypothetical protein